MAFNENRLTALRAKMAEEGIDVLYVRCLSNVAWLSGFERVFDGEPAHAAVLTADACAIHSDSRYLDALTSRARCTSIEIDGSRKSHAAFLADALEEISPHGSDGVLRVGIEDSLTLSEFRLLQHAMEGKPPVNLVELSGFVEGLRQVKDESEIDAMRKAQAITDNAFSRVVKFMRSGMTEREVQLALDNFMFEEGAEGLAFSTIVATGSHAASPHAIPGETKLCDGDAVVMDFGACFGGYCSDMTRTVFVGKPSDELSQAFAVLRKANEECEAMVRVGVCASAVHDHAEKVLAEGGFPGAMGHSLGHSVGIDIHESPNLSPRNHEPLAFGNVVTVEPGIYLPGRFGMRLEDYGVVREGGYEVLTQSTHEMVIVG